MAPSLLSLCRRTAAGPLNPHLARLSLYQYKKVPPVAVRETSGLTPQLDGNAAEAHAHWRPWRGDFRENLL